MAKPKSGLGRGLDALFTSSSELTSTSQRSAPASNDDVPHVAIENIIPNPRQPRRALRDDDPRLLELSDSIKEYGLIQPIIVTRLVKETSSRKNTSSWFGEEGSEEETDNSPSPTSADYQIVAGERRWRAAKLAGLNEVPIVIKDATPQQMLEMALIENIQRADLNPIEEAMAYHTLVKEFGLTQETVAKQVGKDRTTITNSLRLLQLTPKVRETLINQLPNFTEGHARALIGIVREEDQILAMQKIIAEGLNVRQAEELAARMKMPLKQESEQKSEAETSKEAPGTPPQRSSELDSLENHFREALMVKVNLKCNAKGKGTLVLHFNNQDELENLYNKLVKHEG